MPKTPLGEQELEVLRFVSDHPALSVREVFEQFGVPRRLARTTVLTTMENLRAKGYVSRTKEGPVYRYSAVVSKTELLHGLLTAFVQNTLKGSLSPFAAYLSDASDISDEELAELEAAVEQLRASQRRRS